ncbi:hypothetical protein KGF54_001982 [Candida jiufengensis]|uniref:uncharacterized protein n=1 Tax=Candida jiufengensis TaxID=497108 RepID=UPI0022241398|nr:uncharacterized protein KGF54_001982 [Candida jiufengensis]KAI5954207.1 hypothetical protein KGF54_001982 [Candida jiufengensis]
MNIFLNLPEEVVALIIKYVNDKQKLEELIPIPAVQQYALRERYSTYKIDALGEIDDGSIENLKEICLKYNFKPSKIIGNLHGIKQLIKTSKPKPAINRRTRSTIQDVNQFINTIDFGQVEFEVVLPNEVDYFEFSSVVEKLNVTGIHMNKGHIIFFTRHGESRGASFLELIKTSNLTSLTTNYSDSLQIQPPESLKELTIYNQLNQNFSLNLSTLNNLQKFICHDLREMDSLDGLQIPKSIKHLELQSCGMQNVNNLESLIKMNTLIIKDCSNFISFIKCILPESLRNLFYANCLTKEKVNQLYNEVKELINDQFEISDFSSDGKSLVIGPDFIFPPNLYNMTIRDLRGTLHFESQSTLRGLDKLELTGIKNFNLKEFFQLLQNELTSVKINNCQILDIDDCQFPCVKELKFSGNTINTVFKSNLAQLGCLKNLIIESNTYANFFGVDPIKFLRIENTFVDSSGTPKKKVAKNVESSSSDQDVSINMPNLQFLSLGKYNRTLGRRNNFYIEDVPPPVNLNGCKNLVSLSMSSMGYKILNLDFLPNSLKVIQLINFKFSSIVGVFSKFSHLEKLDLRSNEISYSMLSDQSFSNSLKILDLSDNKLEDLTCLYLTNCINLNCLILNKVTGSDNPKGAMELKQLFLKINIDSKENTAELSNRNSKKIFKIFNGIDVSRAAKREAKSKSTLKARSRSRHTDDDPAYRG